MRVASWTGILAVVALIIPCGPAWAAISGLQRVASGLGSPMFVTSAPGDRDRLFIAQRGGAIRILNLNTGTLLTTPFLTMTGLSTAGEGGFLGMAFHPDYFDPDADGYGKFYVKVTTSGSDLSVHIREYSVSATDPNVANPGSLRQVLSYTNPQDNHVGGWIGFSPDNKYLYIANGDGGGGNDTGTGHTSGTGNAQDITNNLLGKMLRIDPLDPDGVGSATYSIPSTNPMVAGAGSSTDDIGDDEIWAYGLRNPFRSSFDRITGDLWIGDVGQGAREEVDFQAPIEYQPGGSEAAANYGWRLREGSIETPTFGIGGPKPPGNVDPVYDYQRPISDSPPIDPAITAMNQYRGTTVIGGYVYRGPDPTLQGKYIFLDRDGGTAGINYWIFDPANPYGSIQNIDLLLAPNVGAPFGPVSMGEDAKGSLYVAYFSNEVYRIATNALLKGDFDADGDVDGDDFDVWKASFGSPLPNPAADGNGNGIADAADYVVWRKNLGTSVHDGLGSGAAVPEPGTWLLLCQVFAAALLSRNRHSVV
jgi:glucose/arabinose dehydrogenase